MAAPGPPPLAGIKVLEFAGLAPGPFCGMLLADAGASVLRIDRAAAGDDAGPAQDLLTRRKASVAVDLKSPRGVALVRALVAAGADVVIDPFRPGVLERLGLGPDQLMPLNPRLVYGRLTGFRRDGRYRDMAGHDINYLAVSGALSLLGRADDSPLPPSNLLADFAGGGATLFQGLLLALLARARDGPRGRGQVVEANMVDGTAYLATFARQLLDSPLGARGRGRNLLDGGCPYYDTYATADGRFVAVGALEPRFFAALARGLGLDAAWEARRYDPDAWPALRARLAAAFASQPRAHWERVFDGTDACCVPVLDYAELRADAAREGDQRPAVALARTPCLALDRRAAAAAAAPADAAVCGQGPGVPGDAYHGHTLAPGHGGEELLRDWFGWTRGAEYGVARGGAFELREPAARL